MGNTSRWVGFVLVTAVLASTGWAFGQDWSQWRGENRDGKASFTVPESWPKTLTQKWKAPVGTGDATPALVGDKLYVFSRQGNDEVLLCLDAGSGKELWKEGYAAQAVTGAASRHPGPRSSPVIADGKVVTLGVGGVLSCVQAADGKLVWRKEPVKGVPRFFTSCSPMILDGKAIAQVGSEDSGVIVAMDLAGEQKWQWTGQGTEYSSPVAMTVGDSRQIVALASKSVVGVAAADGKLLWQIPFVPERRAYNACTPIIEGQTVFFSGAGRGTKAVQVAKQGEGLAAKELWSNADVAVQYNTPVLKDGLLFGLSDRSNLFCLDAKTGKTAWVDSASHGRGGFGSIVDAGSVLMALPSTSELIVYKPSSKEYSEVARYKVAESATYAHPVAAGKRIFVRDETSVTLWTVD